MFPGPFPECVISSIYQEQLQANLFQKHFLCCDHSIFSQFINAQGASGLAEGKHWLTKFTPKNWSLLGLFVFNQEAMWLQI